jgi:hypothetical protein
VKIAFVTTPPSERSEIASYAWSLVPHLRRECEIEVFVASECAGSTDDGTVLRSVAELAPRDFDHIVYQIGNEAQHAFMLPTVRKLGGTVVLHAWSLGELCAAACPALERGGIGALATALREGGMRDMRWYAKRDRDRLAEPRSRNERGTEPVLNRSIVRGGDAFIVHDDGMKRMILADRNAATPIAVLSPDSLPLLAARYVEFLDVCPAPRSKKKSLIRAMVEASDRRREAARSEDAGRDEPAANARRTDGPFDFVDMPSND